MSRITSAAPRPATEQRDAVAHAQRARSRPAAAARRRAAAPSRRGGQPPARDTMQTGTWRTRPGRPRHPLVQAGCSSRAYTVSLPPESVRVRSASRPGAAAASAARHSELSGSCSEAIPATAVSSDGRQGNRFEGSAGGASTRQRAGDRERPAAVGGKRRPCSAIHSGSYTRELAPRQGSPTVRGGNYLNLHNKMYRTLAPTCLDFQLVKIPTRSRIACVWREGTADSQPAANTSDGVAGTPPRRAGILAEIRQQGHSRFCQSPPPPRWQACAHRQGAATQRGGRLFLIAHLTTVWTCSRP